MCVKFNGCCITMTIQLTNSVSSSTSTTTVEPQPTSSVLLTGESSEKNI